MGFFLAMPREIRDQIYEECLITDTILSPNLPYDRGKPSKRALAANVETLATLKKLGFGLISTCHQIRSETKAIFYGKNTFRFELSSSTRCAETKLEKPGLVWRANFDLFRRLHVDLNYQDVADYDLEMCEDLCHVDQFKEAVKSLFFLAWAKKLFWVRHMELEFLGVDVSIVETNRTSALDICIETMQSRLHIGAWSKQAARTLAVDGSRLPMLPWMSRRSSDLVGELCAGRLPARAKEVHIHGLFYPQERYVCHALGFTCESCKPKDWKYGEPCAMDDLACKNAAESHRIQQGTRNDYDSSSDAAHFERCYMPSWGGHFSEVQSDQAKQLVGSPWICKDLELPQYDD